MRRAALGIAALAAAFAVAPAQAAQAPRDLQRVVVQGASTHAAAVAVERAGGRVLRELPIVDGVAAELSAGAQPHGVVVTPDRPVVAASVDTGNAQVPTNVYAQTTQATEVGIPRRSVTVAVIDTGIAPVGGLADNLLTVPDPRTGDPAPCANFSSESGCDDSYGHGTFLAGLIAGDAPYEGMDTNAKLVSVKIAGRDGSADTSQLLAAIQYVVMFSEQLNIKVLNLSLGTDSNHDSRKDPLNRAVQRAWQAGITVVAAASNRGNGPSVGGTISKPADDPLVVTVGAVDDHGTATRADDTVPAFTAQGPVTQGPEGDVLEVPKPDVVAPGVALVSLSSPGSRIEQTARPSEVGVPGYRIGSGTSQATAVVSGAVALLLERREWTPDEVKAALVRGAYPVQGAPRTLVGAGTVSVAAALGANIAGATQPAPRQDPLDPLDLTRGTTYVTSFACGPTRSVVDGEDCTYVHGRLTAQAKRALHGPDLLPFDAAEYVGPWPVLPNGQSWYDSPWYDSQWTQGQSWYGQSWYGQSWYGQSWYETEQPPTTEGTDTPYGTVLRGSTWYGAWR